MRLTFTFAIVLFTASPAVSQSTADICLSLSNSSFIDTSDTSVVVDSLSNEFSHVCSSNYNRVERFNSASGQLKARYGLFKGSGSGGSQSGSMEEQINSACDIGAEAFKQFVRRDISTSSGAVLASYIVQCADIVAQAGRTAIFGTTRVSDEDDRFVARVTYVPGQQGLTYKLSQIEGDDTTCTVNMGASPAIDNVVLSGESIRVFTCTKQIGHSWTGAFQFEPSVGAALPIEVKVSSASAELESMRAIRNDMEARISALEGSGKILAMGTTEGCLVNRIAGMYHWEEACVIPISLPGTTPNYEVLTSLVTYDFPPTITSDEPPVTDENYLSKLKDLLERRKLKAPIYNITTRKNPGSPETGFDIVIASAYNFATWYQVSYIAVAK